MQADRSVYTGTAAQPRHHRENRYHSPDQKPDHKTQNKALDETGTTM